MKGNRNTENKQSKYRNIIIYQEQKAVWSIMVAGY